MSVKYEIKRKDGFTLVRCSTCGFWIWIGSHPENLREIRHVKSPTLKRVSHHKLIFKDAIFDQYGRAYLPELYPFLKVPEEKRMYARVRDARITWDAEQILKVAKHLRKIT